MKSLNTIRSPLNIRRSKGSSSVLGYDVVSTGNPGDFYVTYITNSQKCRRLVQNCKYDEGRRTWWFQLPNHRVLNFVAPAPDDEVAEYIQKHVPICRQIPPLRRVEAKRLKQLPGVGNFSIQFTQLGEVQTFEISGAQYDPDEGMYFITQDHAKVIIWE